METCKSHMIFISWIEHKPFGWWYSPKYKPTQDGFFIGFKESIEFVKDILVKEVNEDVWWAYKNNQQPL